MFTHEVLKGNDKVMGFNTESRQELQRVFKESKDPQEVAKVFSDLYEQPGIPHMERRTSKATEIFNNLSE